MDMTESTSGNSSWIQTWGRAMSAVAMVLLFTLLAVVALLGSNPDQASALGWLAMVIGALGLLLGDLAEPPSDLQLRRVFIGVRVLLAVLIVLLALWQTFR